MARIVDEMEEIEKRLEKQQLCWSAINMDGRADDMEDEGQGSEWSSGKKGRRGIILKAVESLV